MLASAVIGFRVAGWLQAVMDLQVAGWLWAVIDLWVAVLATGRNGPTSRRFGNGHRFGYGRRLIDLRVGMLGNGKV